MKKFFEEVFKFSEIKKMKKFCWKSFKFHEKYGKNDVLDLYFCHPPRPAAPPHPPLPPHSIETVLFATYKFIFSIFSIYKTHQIWQFLTPKMFFSKNLGNFSLISVSKGHFLKFGSEKIEKKFWKLSKLRKIMEKWWKFYKEFFQDSVLEIFRFFFKKLKIFRKFIKIADFF